MKKKLFSFVLALSMICTAVAGLGITAGAAAEDEKIVEFTAAAMQTEYENRTNTDDSAATVMARLGVKVDTSANACWGGTSLEANGNTGNALVIGYGFRNTSTEKHGGWFDFTANSTVNPSPAAMTGGAYMVEAQVVNYIFDGTSRISHIRYELCGTVGSETKSIAQLKFDHKTDKINLIDASGTVVGTSSAESFGQNKPVPGYVRFVIDMNNKTYSAYYAKHANVSALGTVPEELTVLAQNRPFLNSDVTQLTRMNVFGLFPGGGNTEAGFYSVKVSKMADTTADKTAANYDKNDGGTLDVTLTPVTHRLQKITVDDTDLAAEYYTVSGDTYTIAEEALKALSVGSHTLKFVMDGGASPAVALTVENSSSVPTYTVTASSTDEAKGTAAVTSLGTEFEAGASVEVTATPKAGYEFTGWTAAGVTLTEEQKTQNPITITMPAENVTFTAAFDYKALNWVLDPVELEVEYKKTPDGATTNGQLTWLPGAAGVQPNTTNAYAWTNNIISANDTHKKMSLFIKWRKQDGKAPAYGIGSSYDFAANTTFNPNPKPIKNGSYCLEMDFNANLSQSETYVDYVFKGNSGNVLIVRADQASGTVSLRDAGGNVIGTAHTLASKTTTAVYLRLEFDMNQKKLNAWAGSYAAVSDVGVKVGNAPALSSCTKLVMDSSFLSQSEQLTGMDIYAQKGVSADGPMSNTYGMKITELEDITQPPQNYTVVANSADTAKGTAAVTTAGTAFEAGASVTLTATPKAGNKFTGWTATGITLTEAQKTANPLTITMPAENVTLTAAFAAKTNASVLPQTANYDKYAEHANHKDIAVTLTPGEYTFSALKNGSEPLTAETDYTVSGNVYTIKTSYLDKQANGAQTLTFEMDGGTNPTVVITVADSTPPTYTVTASSADAAKGTAAVTTTGTAFEAGTSVTVQATPTAGNKFTGWTATGITLTEAQKTANPLTITMPAGNVTLAAAFAAKTNASVTPQAANYDKYAEHANHKDIAVTLTAGDYTFRALKNSTTTLTLTEGTDYTVSGNVYTIKMSYLETLAKGERTLMFEMDGGTNPTVVITVANSTPTPPPTYTVTASSADAAKGTAAVKTGEGGPFEAGVRVTIEATPTAGNQFTGWTATGITLTEEQKTQNPLMIFMPAENVTLTAAFAEKVNALITPTTANYDKYAEHVNHKDIAVTLEAGDYTFSALKNGAAALTAETDYTVSGNVYTIKTSYLDTLANGAQTLTFEMDGGVNPTVVITVADSTPTTPGQTAHTVTVSAGTGGTARVGGGKTEFLPGEIVTVEAAVGSGYSFGSWKATGAALYPNGTSATFTMPNNDVTVYATFVKDRQSGGGGGGGTQRGSSTNAGVVVVPENTGTSGTSDNNYREPDVDHVSSNYFADVSTESTWAYGYIEHLAAAGIVSGDQNRNFAPKTNVTREEFLKMLMGALNITATDGGYGFSDIGNDDWFAPYVYTARNLGIVNGMGDGTFGIGQTITREDMAVMASRALAAAGKTLTQTQQTALVDAVQISDYAQSAAQQLASAGVICGDEHAAFRPQDTALREEAAKVIYYIWVA